MHRAIDVVADPVAAVEMALAGSDAVCVAGSIFLVMRPREGPPTLRFTLTQNHSMPELQLQEFEMPIDHHSLAGYCTITRESLRIDDVYDLHDDTPYRFNRAVDDVTGYRTKSTLVIPMQTHLQEVVGVVQLINQKRNPNAVLRTHEDVAREVVPFDVRSVEMVEALASQAGVAIENSRLYEDIERLFEGFVTAAVTATGPRRACAQVLCHMRRSRVRIWVRWF